MPAGHKKMLDNIRKTQERAKRKKATGDSQDGDEEEEDSLRGKNKPER